MQTTTAEQIRATVREAYGAVATQKQQGGCCGGGGSSSCCGPTGSSSTRLGYIDADLAAVPDGADLGLGEPLTLARVLAAALIIAGLGIMKLTTPS